MTAALALQPASATEVAQGVLAAEAAGLRALAASLDGAFTAAVERLAECSGRVVVSGMGKSGLVGAQDRRHPGLHRHARPCSSTPPRPAMATSG